MKNTKVNKVLLIQPWISDFAAYNLWIRPLGLYRLAEFLWQRGISVEILDCLSCGVAPGKFPRKIVETPSILKGFPRHFARYGIDKEEFLTRLKKAYPFDAVLISTLMSYWYHGTKWVVDIIRENFKDIKIGIGGIYTTLWQEHAHKIFPTEKIFSGPIEKISLEMCNFLDIDYKPKKEFKPWYELGLHDGLPFASIRTAIGCPFSCTYCASRIVSGRFKPKNWQEVFNEINFLAKQGVKDICFYDDALLVGFSKRLKPVLEQVIKNNLELNFHTPNGLHARFLTKEVAKFMKETGFKTIRLSLETVDKKRQSETGGKVSNDDFLRAVDNLFGVGIEPKDIRVYLLVGLPGQDLEEVRKGVDFVKSLGIKPALAEFSPIPGTVEWKRLEKIGLIHKDIDPLLTNNTVFFRLFCPYESKELEELLRYSRRL